MKITGRKTLWEGSFLRMELLTYEDRKGNKRHWEVAKRTTPEGVVIIAAITADRNLILIRQYRPALDSYVIELPAGLIDRGESPSDACRRELIEETGHYSDSVSSLSNGVISTGVLAENWHVMLALDVRPATEDELRACPPDETEDIEVIPVALEGAIEALSEMEAEGAKVDIRIYGIIELARRKLKKLEA
jgi:ADP-ribose pyrophosphatase